MGITVFSCKKESVEKKDRSYLQYQFDVAEQKSVLSYTIEVSTDGKSFTDRATIPASIKEEDSYTMTTDVTDLFEVSETLQSRIRSTDIDGVTGYSLISLTHRTQ